MKMKLGIINHYDQDVASEMDSKLNNFNDVYFMECENLPTVREASGKDAVLIVKSDKSDINKVCQNIIEIKRMSIPVWVMTKERTLKESFVYIQMGVCGIFNSNFSVDEIALMINNTLQYKSNSETKKPINAQKSIKLNRDNKSLCLDDQLVFMTESEFIVLEYLFKNQDKVCTYEEIFEKLRNNKSNRKVDKFLLANLVCKIREKIRNKINDKSEIIKTIRSVGYMMNSKS
jgi:two-component system response regulator ArlR